MTDVKLNPKQSRLETENHFLKVRDFVKSYSILTTLILLSQYKLLAQLIVRPEKIICLLLTHFYC